MTKLQAQKIIDEAIMDCGMPIDEILYIGREFKLEKELKRIFEASKIINQII